jgi:hypothetical protein
MKFDFLKNTNWTYDTQRYSFGETYRLHLHGRSFEYLKVFHFTAETEERDDEHGHVTISGISDEILNCEPICSDLVRVFNVSRD